MISKLEIKINIWTSKMLTITSISKDKKQSKIFLSKFTTKTYKNNKYKKMQPMIRKQNLYLKFNTH